MMPGRVVVRLDDVRGLCKRLARVWDTLAAHGVPVHLHVIPADLDGSRARALGERASATAVPLAVHQHGYKHVDHSGGDRRSEFGDYRTVQAQRADLVAGRTILEEALPDFFEPIFSPPWDRCGRSTLEVLASEGYLAASVRKSRSTPTHPSLAAIPMTTDPVRWGMERAHRPWEETRTEIVASLEAGGYAGLELHHDLVDEHAARGLDRLLSHLQARGASFPTMRAIAAEGGPT